MAMDPLLVADTLYIKSSRYLKEFKESMTCKESGYNLVLILVEYEMGSGLGLASGLVSGLGLGWVAVAPAF